MIDIDGNVLEDEKIDQIQNRFRMHIAKLLDDDLEIEKEKTNQSLFEKKVSQVREYYKAQAEEIKQKLPKIYSKDLVEILFRLPYTTRQHLINENIGNPKTVGNYLQTLEEHGFLKSVKVGKEKLYLNQRLLTILEGKQL